MKPIFVRQLENTLAALIFKRQVAFLRRKETQLLFFPTHVDDEDRRSAGVAR